MKFCTILNLQWRKLLCLCVVIYIILFYFALDRSDKYAILCYLKHSDRFMNLDISISKKLIFLWRILQIPFRRKSYFAEISEGAIYGMIDFEKYPQLTDLMNRKDYWGKIFEKYHIHHPKTMAYNNGSGAQFIRKINDLQTYIAKPNIGGLGIGIKRINGKEAKKICTTKNNIIIQQSLKDCLGYARHFRFITLNGNKFALYLLEESSGKEIASNHSNGGKVYLCTDTCSKLTKYENKVLHKTLNNLARLHKKEFTEIFGIGWDIMLNCERGKNSKAYALEGNVAHSAWFYPDLVNKNLVNKYKKEVNIHHGFHG